MEVINKNIIDFKAADFAKFIKEHKPKEIYNKHYSATKPLYVIKKYVLTVRPITIIWYCNNDVAKNTIQSGVQMLADILKYGGYPDEYYIKQS